MPHKGKGKKHFRGQEDAKLKRDELREAERCPENDWRWYAQNPALIQNYASYPFGVALGTMQQSGLPSMDQCAFPGAMAINFIPTIGYTDSENAPVNIAMRNVYSFVRHVNSGHTNYDSPDLMIYLLAMDSIYMYHAFLKRIASIVLDYSTLNRYYPEALLLGMGVDPSDIAKNINDLRGYINIFTTKAGSMCVPNSMSYTARHVWMASHIYLDSTTQKAQTYFYNPVAYHKFVAGQEAYAGTLVWAAPIKGNTYGTTHIPCSSFNDLVSFGNDLLNAIIPNEDMNIMSGDVLKAFGQNGVIQLTGIMENAVILPEYNQEVLSQMENSFATGINVAELVGKPAVTQDTTVGGGYLKTPNSYAIQLEAPAMTVTTPLELETVPKRFALNFHKSVVTPEEVMVATRLMVGVASVTISGKATSGTINGTIDLKSYGSELVTTMVCISRELDGAGPQSSWLFNELSATPLVYLPTVVSAVDGFNTLVALSTFDWHPFVYPVLIESTAAPTSIWHCKYPVGDMDNYTYIDSDNIYNMHQVALLSEFSVPQMGVLA